MTRVMTVLAVLFLVLVLAAVLLRAGALRSGADSTGEPPMKVAGATVTARGWDRAALDRILADFAGSYALPGAAFQTSFDSAEAATIAFPNGIRTDHLLFLVNYLNYPRDFDLKTRSIAVAGHATLGNVFGPGDPALAGRQVTIYVPAGDREYDLVYVQVKSGGAYRVRFTNMRWQAETDARMPPAVAEIRDVAR